MNKNKATPTNPDITLEKLMKYSNATISDLNGEKALWQSVIVQAAYDAVKTPLNTDETIIRKRARSWFSLKNKDFILVCSFAGFNPENIIAGIKRILTKSSKLSLKHLASRTFIFNKLTTTSDKEPKEFMLA